MMKCFGQKTGRQCGLGLDMNRQTGLLFDQPEDFVHGFTERHVSGLGSGAKVQKRVRMLSRDRVEEPRLESTRMGSDLIFHQFSRSKVERLDFTHFLSLHAPDKLPTGRKLRAMMGGMVMCIDGYDDDPREIHTIPEVRRFYSAFHEAWPYWLYFCNLDQDAFKMMVFCCMKSFTAFKVDNLEQCAVQCDPMEVAAFIAQDFAPINLMCERAGMFESLIEQRTKDILAHFGLPVS